LEAPSDDTPRLLKRRKANCLAALPIVLAMNVILTSLVPGNETAIYWGNLAAMLTSLLLILLWCNTDAEERGVPWSRAMGLLIVAIVAIGVPYYLFRTRGRAAWTSIGWLSLYLLGVTLLVNLTDLGFATILGD
jgi:hypothetical protein